MATRTASRTARATAQLPKTSPPPPASKKRAPGVAALAPLAVGLASGLLPSGHPTVAPTPGTPTAASGPTAKMFKLACALPFAGTLNPPSDDHCGVQGGSSDPAKQAESRAKNNFCAPEVSPLVLTHQVLLAMQTKSTEKKLPKSLLDRSPLVEMGEGKFVSYVAFVKDAHYSDVSAGEANNCNIPGNSTNDIHIVLVQNLSDDECASTTAEMSPHFRPESWTPASIHSAQGHPVRIRGQLFYDGSHTPCTATSRPNPQRASLWEIHPVYSLDVCRFTDMAKCQESDAASWVPLDQSVSSENQ
jgi:hypothetical protein